MNSKLLFHKALTMCLTAALIATYSMVTLAADGRASGEIVVTGLNEAVVTVNGEVVKSGRTIFSSSTISTQEGAGATINLGKTGRIEIAPNSTFVLTFDNSAISGNLTAGSISVLSAAKGVNVTTSTGQVTLNAGESVSAASGASSKAPATASGNDWWMYALIFGGAVAGIVMATSQDNGNRFGSGTSSPVSPVN